MQIDDQVLMALADNELDAATAVQVRNAVAADPALQARLRVFIETRNLMKSSAAPLASSPKDADLIAQIRAASTPSTQMPVPANDNRRPLLAIAAAAALAVIGLGWWQTSGPADQGFGAAQLAALDSLPSGESRAVEGGEMTMIASYRNDADEFCREFETTSGDARQAIVACREAEGWAQRFAATIESSGDFQPASGDIPGLDAYLTESGAGQPLTAEDEAAALAGK